MDEKHILVSLGDDKVKQIGEIIGNKTCNKILDLLAEENMTVTEISKEMKIPLNTVDYNIKKLVKAGLIEKATHWWSVKGKKMNSYKVSNKKIIISPKNSIKKIFIFVLGITGAMALTIKKFVPISSKKITEKLAYDNSLMTTPEIESMAMNGGAVNKAFGTIANTSFWNSLNPWAWFLIGAWLAILLFFILTIYNERRKK